MRLPSGSRHNNTIHRQFKDQRSSSNQGPSKYKLLGWTSPKYETSLSEEESQKKCRWWRHITVEPVMFLYMMAFMLTTVVEQAFFVDKACRVNLKFSDAICSNLTDEENKEYNKQVQVAVSNFYQYNNIASHVIPLVLALFLGAWSDRRGRKLPLLLGLIGKLYYSIMIIVNALEETFTLEAVLWSASLPTALTGADLAIFAASFSYIADITTVEERTLRVTILDVVYLSTMPIGIAIGKYLWTSVTGRSYAIMFAINASLMVIAILYALFCLKWQTADGQKPVPVRSCCCDFFDTDHLVQSVKAVVKKRPGNRRMYLLILLISMALYTFQRDEKTMTYLYTQLQFQWSAETYSDYRTYQSASYVVGTLLGIHVMTKLLRLRDTVMIMVGATAHALARVVFALAQVPWLFYVGGTIVALGPIVAPVLRSMTSKIVPISERGKVFAILAAADNAVPMFSGILYTQVYNATIHSAPATIFWVTVASQICVFLLILCIHISLGSRNLEDRTEVTIQEEDSDPEAKT